MATDNRIISAKVKLFNEEVENEKGKGKSE